MSKQPDRTCELPDDSLWCHNSRCTSLNSIKRFGIFKTTSKLN